MKMKSLFPLLLILLLALTSCGDGGGGGGGSSDSSGNEAAAALEYVECKHTLVDGSTTECGYLTVPENRDDPESADIQIYFAIFKNPDSDSGEEGSGPLFYLTGGPGASTAAAYSLFEDPTGSFRESFGDNRDFIVIDQRGTNYSLPALYCSEELGPLRETVYQMTYRDGSDMRIDAMEDCYSRLVNEGVDLSGYDVLENAADIDYLRQALGYETINIYSASYGTRLAMIFMKEYPDVIRSVVLDSVLPPDLNPFEAEVEGVLFSFESLFDAARDDFPEIETYFYGILDSLEETPVEAVGYHYDSDGTATEHIISVNGVKFVIYVLSALKETPYDTSLPKNIHYMYTTADYQLVADAWIADLDFFYPDGEAGSDSPSVGMFNSVFGANDAYYTNEDTIQSIIDLNVDSYSIASWLSTHFIHMEPEILRKWDVDPLPESIREPVISDIPVLMMVGTLDNATPSIFSDQYPVNYFSNSYYFEIVAGHAVAYLECVDDFMNDFLKDPTTEPVSTCPEDYEWDPIDDTTDDSTEDAT